MYIEESITVLFLLFVLWTYCCFLLFRILESEYPEKFSMMGRPSWIKINSRRAARATMTFVIKREWRSLENKRLSLLGNAMIVVAATFIFSFWVMLTNLLGR